MINNVAKILIVDDDQGFANQLAQGLASAGHRCAVQGAGEDVVRMARRHKPDLLVLDLMLPGISGFQVCREIRSDEELFRLPIMMISAMNSDEEVKHGLAQGADDYVTKPIQLNGFLQRVSSLLEANQDAPMTDGTTSLLDSLGFRKELQRRLTRSASFGLVYVELMKLRAYQKAAGAEARDRALRHLARALQQCGEGFGERFFAGHLGGGHFMCVVPPKRAETYCARIYEAWSGHRVTLLDEIPANTRDESAAPLELLFCVTVREEDESMTPAEMLEVVSRIRELRAAQSGGGIHLDRRHLPQEAE